MTTISLTHYSFSASLLPGLSFPLPDSSSSIAVEGLAATISLDPFLKMSVFHHDSSMTR